MKMDADTHFLQQVRHLPDPGQCDVSFAVDEEYRTASPSNFDFRNRRPIMFNSGSFLYSNQRTLDMVRAWNRANLNSGENDQIVLQGVCGADADAHPLHSSLTILST